MKKKSILVLTLTAMLLSGCGGEVVTESPQDATENAVQQEAIATTEEATEVVEVEEVEPERLDTHFRNAYWGDSKEDVIKHENEVELIEVLDLNNYTLANETIVIGRECIVLYEFQDEVLYRGGYSFQEDLPTGTHYINSFEDIKDSLTTLYGNPARDEIINFERQDSIDYAGLGSALEFGWVGYVVEWNTEVSTITMTMMEQGSGIGINLIYQDINKEEIINTDGL